MGALHSMLGMTKVERLPDGSIKTSNERAILDLLQRFNLQNCKQRDTPAEAKSKLTAAMCPPARGEDVNLQQQYRVLVGSLMYLMTTVRPDIAPAVQDLGRFLHNPGIDHWRAALRVMYYLKGTTSMG
jgi:hypothetical protein